MKRPQRASPYMAGRCAYIAGDDVTPPGGYTREQADEFRRGWKDARIWHLRRAGKIRVMTR